MPSCGRSLRTSCDAGRDLAQRVDVEAGVGLVEHGDVGLEHRHLEHLVALLLAAGEALVEVALLEAVVHAEALASTAMSCMRTSSTEKSSMPLRRAIAWRRKLKHRDARDLLGVLEAEEQARGRPARRSGAAVMSSPASRIRPPVTS